MPLDGGTTQWILKEVGMMKNMRDIRDEVRTALDNKKFMDLKNILASITEADIAELLHDAQGDEKIALFRLLS